MRPELRAYLRHRDEVLDRLRATLVQALDLRVDPTTLDPDVPLFGSGLRLDSIDSLELVVAVEAEFGVEVTDRETGSPSALRTLNTLCDRIMAGPRGEPVTLGEQVTAIRTSVALGRRTGTRILRVSGPDAWDDVDRLVATDLHLRDGELRQALILNDDGTIAADVTVGSDDEDLLLFVDGDAAVDGQDLGADHVLLGIDGPFAWELLARWDTPGVVGLPYLSLYRPRPNVICLRAGRTGEYGYDLLVPAAEADAIAAELTELGEAFDARWADAPAYRYCALENWFYDHGTLAGFGLTPVELQLQWRLSATKPYRGRAAIEARRPGSQRITGVVGPADLQPGPVELDGEAIGRVLVAHPAHRSEGGLRPPVPPPDGREGDGAIGIALLDREYAHSGVGDYAVAGAPIRTVSPPFVLNRSLFVRGQRHSYATRDTIVFPD